NKAIEGLHDQRRLARVRLKLFGVAELPATTAVRFPSGGSRLVGPSDTLRLDVRLVFGEAADDLQHELPRRPRKLRLGTRGESYAVRVGCVEELLQVTTPACKPVGLPHNDRVDMAGSDRAQQ